VLHKPTLAKQKRKDEPPAYIDSASCLPTYLGRFLPS
jgi:hypothetical protein